MVPTHDGKYLSTKNEYLTLDGDMFGAMDRKPLKGLMWNEPGTSICFEWFERDVFLSFLIGLTDLALFDLKHGFCARVYSSPNN